jgi:uncharacterized protein YecE (DUF72 family)
MPAAASPRLRFRKWFKQTPDDFVFSLKAPRFAVKLRLQAAAAEIDTGDRPEALADWCTMAKAWQNGEAPASVPQFAPDAAAPQPRDVFIYVINGAKERAPAAAEALISRLLQ